MNPTTREKAALVGQSISIALALFAAQGANAQTEAPDRATAFVAVDGPTREDVPGGGLLVAAYMFGFVLLSFYVLYVLQIQHKALAALEELQKKSSRD